MCLWVRCPKKDNITYILFQLGMYNLNSVGRNKDKPKMENIVLVKIGLYPSKKINVLKGEKRLWNRFYIKQTKEI